MGWILSLNGRRFLVTGGAGFIGSALVRALLQRGAIVRSFDNGSRGEERRLKGLGDRLEPVSGDIRDAAAVADAVKGVDSICHLAYVNGTEHFYKRPEVVLEVAVKGIVNVLDACVMHGVRDLVLASSSEVYQQALRIPTSESVPLSVPDPLNARYSYGGGKIISELLAINYGRRYFDRVVIFRPHNVYGPDMGNEHVIPQLTLRAVTLAASTTDLIRLPIQGDGTETRSFIYVDDAIEGIICVIERGAHLGIYHLGTENEISIADLAMEIGRCLGRSLEVVPSDRPAGAAVRRCPDTAKLRALGFTPHVALAEGLRRTVAWYTQQARKPTSPVGARTV